MKINQLPVKMNVFCSAVRDLQQLSQLLWYLAKQILILLEDLRYHIYSYSTLMKAANPKTSGEETYTNIVEELCDLIDSKARF